MFENESAFESYLRDLIKKRICSNHKDLELFDNKKAVDILICRNGEKPSLYFIEVKYHKKSHGRLGFGSSSGGGFQPEIVAKAPDYLESNLRWIIAGEGHEGTGIIFVPSSVIRNYVSGGNVGQKFNNIQQKIFKEVDGFSEDALVIELESWLTS
ncbi:hypothetical protein [Vibrio sp. ZF 223]|uniref:hypothetical protein n=1 Tax=Vibrio sp. ZF 223 TaxID=2056191 RepID=UPI0011B20312|nr:hypothetical protein [Vibrio sp. ZF 223]